LIIVDTTAIKFTDIALRFIETLQELVTAATVIHGSCQGQRNS